MFLSLVQQRRSIRKFEKKPVETDKLNTLIEIALRAPSSRGFNPWESIIAIGYPAEKLRSHDKSELGYEKISVNAYGKSSYEP